MITVAKTTLSSDARARHAALRDYFCDKDAIATERPDGWDLKLYWPGDPARHVDPYLDEGLAWWGAGIERRTMFMARRREGRVLRALYDTWTTVSWSSWLGRHGSPSPPVTILHVDDHKDLGSPRFIIDGPRWRDAITGCPVQMDDAASMTAALESGALGMGSILTPWLHALPTTNVRHLCQPPKVNQTSEYRIELTQVEDRLLDPGAQRPAVRLVSGPSGPGQGHYRLTTDCATWLDGLADGPLLLHIDMDYFNNRYDGDSEWQDRQPKLDPSMAAISEKIDELTAALGQAGIMHRIADAVIAYSPGFFPAEFWREADLRLRRGLEALHADKN